MKERRGGCGRCLMIYIKMRGESGSEVIRVEEGRSIRVGGHVVVGMAVLAGFGAGAGGAWMVREARELEGSRAEAVRKENEWLGRFEETTDLSPMAKKIVEEFPRIKFDFHQTEVGEDELEKMWLSLGTFEESRDWLRGEYGVECESLVKGEPILVKAERGEEGVGSGGLATKVNGRYRINVFVGSGGTGKVLFHEAGHVLCQKGNYDLEVGEYEFGWYQEARKMQWYGAKGVSDGGGLNLFLVTEEGGQQSAVWVQWLTEYQNTALTWLIWNRMQGGMGIPDYYAIDLETGEAIDQRIEAGRY